MNKFLLFIPSILLSLFTYAQTIVGTKPTPDNNAVSYYQSVDLNPNTPCNCNQKTARTQELNRGLIPNDVTSYKLHAYSFRLPVNTIVASKLFKAFENDATIYKVSMKEWDSFMLLTTDKFDVASFEEAAKTAFDNFTPITAEDFLVKKNTTSYNELVKFKSELNSSNQNQPTNK